MRILIVTNMYPNDDDPISGIFVKEQVDSIRAQGINVEVLFFDGRRNKLKYLMAMLQVLRKSITNRYDIVHAQYGLTGIVARVQWKYPLVVSFHGSDINISWQNFLSKVISSHIDKSIVMTKKLKKLLGAKNATVIPCGVNFDLMTPMKRIEARERLNLSPNKRYLLFPGNPKNHIKRYDIFDDVLKILENHGILVEELVLSSIPHFSVPLYYNASDVTVLVSDSEGSPTVIKEAMACNTPIVSVDVGDVREIIGDTEGCYIAERNPEDIAKKIGLVLRRNRRTNGREKIKHLGLENIAKKLISVYKEVEKK